MAKVVQPLSAYLSNIKKIPKRRKVWSDISDQKSYSVYSLKYCRSDVCKLDTQILLSGDLEYVDQDKLKVLKDDTSEVEKMPKALIKSLENKRLNP